MRDVEFRSIATQRGREVIIEWTWIRTGREAEPLPSLRFQSLASCMADAEDTHAREHLQQN